MSNLQDLNDAIGQCTFLETNDVTFTEQLPESTDSEKLEPKTILDSVDAVIDLQEPPQPYSEPRTDLFGPDVNAPPEPEVLVPTASEPDEAINVDPHENNQRILSTCSDIEEDDGVFCGPSSDHCIDELEMENEEFLTIVFHPDYMVYGDSYCSDCVLTFTSSCVKIEGSTLDADDKSFKYQWGVEDINYIKSHWYDLVGMAIVKIRVLNEDTVQAENVEWPSDVELKFAIVGANWYQRQEAITSLNAAYKSLFSSILESQDTHGHTQAPYPKYFPNFDKPFDEVIYPKGDIDAVSISKRDVDLLLPDTFVNDTIIDFYIKYLKNKIKPEERHRFHFFNSFFFRKLADPDKDRLDASEGKAAYQRVRKWTRKVNLFEKDFVFIPVNYNYHWSLIVMCHLGEVATYKDKDVTELSKVPCVLHMDSIRGSHTGLKGIMQSYLKEEWKSRLQESSEDISSKFDNLRFISLELPQQPNSYDCGLFLLHYVQLFLEEAPIDFNPFTITKSVNFLNVDWFPPSEASMKRVVIQRLVYDLLQQPYHEAPSNNKNNNGEMCNLATNHQHDGSAVNFFPEMSNPNCSMPYQSSQAADEGIEISLLQPTTPQVQPPFEAASFLSMQFPSFNETTFDGYKPSLDPPVQEDVETGGGQFVYSPIEITLGPDNEVSTQPFSSQGQESHQNNNFEASPQTSISGCEDSLEVINGNDQRDVGLEFRERRDQSGSPLMEPVPMLDGNANYEHLDFSLNGFEMQANGSDESSGLESDVQHPTKRMRMSQQPPFPLEGASA